MPCAAAGLEPEVGVPPGVAEEDDRGLAPRSAVTRAAATSAEPTPWPWCSGSTPTGPRPTDGPSPMLARLHTTWPTTSPCSSATRVRASSTSPSARSRSRMRVSSGVLVTRRHAERRVVQGPGRLLVTGQLAAQHEGRGPPGHPRRPVVRRASEYSAYSRRRALPLHPQHLLLHGVALLGHLAQRHEQLAVRGRRTTRRALPRAPARRAPPSVRRRRRGPRSRRGRGSRVRCRRRAGRRPTGRAAPTRPDRASATSPTTSEHRSPSMPDSSGTRALRAHPTSGAASSTTST